MKSDDVWVFGYGSLIWRPDLPFKEKRIATIDGWKRRFWQGSHDHRGLPNAPGRVVTLIPCPGASCEGMAYLIESAVAQDTFVKLDYREKNGYERHEVRLLFADGESESGVVYIATQDNHAFLGPAPTEDLVAQINISAGPSGTNFDYLMELAAALRRLGINDDHVFELEHHCRAQKED